MYNKLKPKTKKLMKNLFLALALVGYIGTTTASSIVLSNDNAICFHEEKGKKDKKKKKCSKSTKACSGTKAEGEEKTEAKSCDKTATKACCAKKVDAVKTEDAVK